MEATVSTRRSREVIVAEGGVGLGGRILGSFNDIGLALVLQNLTFNMRQTSKLPPFFPK